jgi:hypothetical protein
MALPPKPFNLEKMQNLSDCLSDADIDEILAVSGYFNIKWAEALHLVMDWRGLPHGDQYWDPISAWELSNRLQARANRARKKG